MRNPRNGPQRQFAEQAAKSTETEACIVWPFTTKGYPHMRDWRQPVLPGQKRRPQVGVHRLVWELVNGPFPDGLVARHMCGNGALRCVNPNHIVPGTPAENSQDMVAHGHVRPNPWNRSLTPEQVRAIRVAPGFQREVAARFGIDQATVSRIRNGKWYVHVD